MSAFDLMFWSASRCVAGHATTSCHRVIVCVCQHAKKRLNLFQSVRVLCHSLCDTRTTGCQILLTDSGVSLRVNLRLEVSAMERNLSAIFDMVKV
jgi:hypothetical protein